MAINEILPFAQGVTANVPTQSEYVADAERPTGNVPGPARSKLNNKALRQATAIAAGLAQWMADKQATNITDVLTPAQLAAILSALISNAFTPWTGATGATQLASGGTAAQPASPVEGMLRYNTDLDVFEGFANGIWTAISGGTPGDVFGPASSVNNQVALFNGTTGKLLKAGSVVGNSAYATLITTLIDATVGRVMTTGAAGWLVAGPNNIIANIDDTTVPSGSYQFAAAFPSTGNKPAGSAANGSVLLERFTGTILKQTWTDVVGGGAITPRTWIRTSYAANTWGAWVEVWTTANLTKTTTKTDTTVGRMVQVGDYGLGVTMNTTNLNTLTGSGLFNCGDVTGTPGPSILGWWVEQIDSGAWKNQTAWQQGAPQNQYVRSSGDGVTWTQWTKVVMPGDYGLGKSSNSTLDIDVPTNYTNGFYFVAAGTPGTFPGGLTSGNMLVIQQAGPASGTGTRQIFMATTTNDIWVRQWPTSGWTPWENLRSLGENQTWQNVSASRALNTVYTNSTGRSIDIKVSAITTSAAVMQTFINGSASGVSGLGISQLPGDMTTIPPGATYKCQPSAGTPSSLNWWELR